MAIKFELAADILRTAMAPTWNVIGQLAAIVALRTVLNYFLQQEIARPGAERNGSCPREFDRSVTLACGLHLGE